VDIPASPALETAQLGQASKPRRGWNERHGLSAAWARSHDGGIILLGACKPIGVDSGARGRTRTGRRLTFGPVKRLQQLIEARRHAFIHRELIPGANLLADCSDDFAVQSPREVAGREIRGHDFFVVLSVL
jgi:hypothetical protein